MKKQKVGLLKIEWFGTDKAMTYTAFDLFIKRLVDEEGFDPSS
jgi:hypothetical protein